MEDIIAPISKELLKAELTEDKRLRMTNKSNNQIYIITAQDSPNTMKEIGRRVKLHFGLPVAERACRWILMNTISWTIPISS